MDGGDRQQTENQEEHQREESVVQFHSNLAPNLREPEEKMSFRLCDEARRTEQRIVDCSRATL
jgi:hypothetical protein